MKSLHSICILIFFFCFLFTHSTPVQAQKKFQHDSAYYETFPEKINVRLYLSQKYVHLNFPETGNTNGIEYKANPKLNLGVGFSVKGFSLNIFNGFSFLNKSKEAKGKTKGLNLQLHLYPKKWTIDLLVELPKGFHLEPKGLAGAGANNYYYRADIQSSVIGLSAYYIPNKEKFSYRAAILQTEWQKKSAGSFLYGGEVYRGQITGDSALIPKLLSNGIPQAAVTKLHFFSFGPGAGYGHTFVIDKHFYITGSAVANLDVNITSEEGATKKNKVSLNTSQVFKAALGYNSRTWNVSANWLGNGIRVKGALSTKNYFLPSGNVRLVIARKFNLHKHHSS